MDNSIASLVDFGTYRLGAYRKGLRRTCAPIQSRQSHRYFSANAKYEIRIAQTKNTRICIKYQKLMNWLDCKIDAIDRPSQGADPGFSGKGVHVYKGMGVRIADISKISHGNEIIWSH